MLSTMCTFIALYFLTKGNWLKGSSVQGRQVNLIACFESLCTCLFAFGSNKLLKHKFKIKSCLV